MTIAGWEAGAVVGAVAGVDTMGGGGLVLNECIAITAMPIAAANPIRAIAHTFPRLVRCIYEILAQAILSETAGAAAHRTIRIRRGNSIVRGVQVSDNAARPHRV
jgi:hypothetical protein